MAIEDATDRAAFFDPEEFGVAATIGGGTVNGIFDNGYVAELDVESTRPTFTCATADVSTVAHGDSITISGTAYTVRGIEPDGTGVTTLVLETP